jgi:hypothetical protein
MADIEHMVQPGLHPADTVNPDSLTSVRIEQLNAAIDHNPENYLAASQKLGGLALGYTLDGVLKKNTDEPTARLSMLIKNGDFKDIEFDIQSDKAIYHDSTVKDLIAKVHRAKSGTDEEKLAKRRRDMHTLSIYISRVLTWKNINSEQRTPSGSGHNTAA